MNISDYHEVLRNNVRTRLYIDFDSKLKIPNVTQDVESSEDETENSEDENTEDENTEDEEDEKLIQEDTDEDGYTQTFKNEINAIKESYQHIITFIIKYLKDFKDKINFTLDDNVFSKYIVCDSIRKCKDKNYDYVKVSQHVIFPNVIFDDINVMNQFMEKVKAQYLIDNGTKHISTCNGVLQCTCNKEFNSVDLNVYKSVNFRTPLTVSRGTIDRDKIPDDPKLIIDKYSKYDDSIDEYLISRSTEHMYMYYEFGRKCEHDIKIIILDNNEKMLQPTIIKRSKKYNYSGIKTIYFFYKNESHIKGILDTISKSNYFLNVTKLVNITDDKGKELTPNHFNSISINNGPLSNISNNSASMLLLQLIPDFESKKLQTYQFMITKDTSTIKFKDTRSRDEYLRDEASKIKEKCEKLKSLNKEKNKLLQQDSDISSINKSSIDKLLQKKLKVDSTTQNGKPYKLLLKYTNIKTINKCLSFISKYSPNYYTEYKLWSRIGLSLGHLYRFYLSKNDTIKANEILNEYNTFSMNSKTSYKGIEPVMNELLKSTTSLTHYDKKYKINSLFNILKNITSDNKKIGEEEYYKLFPKKQLLETFDEFRNKTFDSEKQFTKEINNCVILTPTSHIVKLFKSSCESEYKYSYVQTQIQDAMKQYNSHNVFIKQSTEGEEKKIKKYKLGAAIIQFCTSQVSSVIFNPTLPFGIQQDKEYNKSIFNTFREIPVTPVQLNQEDKDLIIVNRFIEDLCGKELNPNTYREYYDYVLNYLSWIYANKRSSGIMLLFAGSQGSGKTLMADFIKSIFTHEYSINSSNDTFFNNKFNSQIVGKLIVTIDEFKVESLDKYKNTVESKDMVEITTKGKNTISMRTYHNYIATSNTIDQKLDSEDRRTCVINSGYKIDKSYASKVLVPILKDKSTINKFRNVLIERWKNIKDTFNVSSFPVSELKVAMTQNNLSDFNSYLIKEYYYIKSTDNILFNNFRENYCTYVDDVNGNDNKNKTTITDKSFHKLYSSLGIKKKQIRSNGTRPYILEINNIDKLYERLIDNKKALINACIELNDNKTITDENLFKSFVKENDSQENENENKTTEEQPIDESTLLERLTVSKTIYKKECSLIETLLNINNKISIEDKEVIMKLFSKYTITN
jgi:hypothetical protein